MQAAGYSYNWYRNTLCREEKRLAAEQETSAYALIDQGILKAAPGADGLLYLPYMLGAVSYTHLDVYKRQGLCFQQYEM